MDFFWMDVWFPQFAEFLLVLPRIFGGLFPMQKIDDLGQSDHEYGVAAPKVRTSCIFW